MTEPSENYVPMAAMPRMRRQAARVWAIAAGIAFVWLLLIVMPPVLAANGQSGVSDPLYHFFSFVCHQIPERSFHVLEHPFAVCSRCLGVYFGLLAGLLAYPLWRRIDDIEPLPRLWLFASMAPIAVDWALGVLGVWENNHATRFITGLILGFGCATYIVPALVEITWNLLRKPAR